MTALTRPHVATFTRLIPGASWAGVVISWLLGGTLDGLLRAIGSAGTDQGPVELFIAGLIADGVIFCIIAAYTILVTRIVTKPESQVRQVYALALFWPLLIIPLNLLSAGGAIGLLGTLLWLPATLYGLFLTYLVVQAVPGLSPRSARFVILVPVILLVLVGLMICGLFTLLAGNLNTLENK